VGARTWRSLDGSFEAGYHGNQDFPYQQNQMLKKPKRIIYRLAKISIAIWGIWLKMIRIWN
jgi:alpha-glucuronidase